MVARFTIACLLLAGVVGSVYSFPGTDGVPLGGMGTGYLVFDPTNGNFRKRGAPDEGWYTERSNNSAFHLFVNAAGASENRQKIKSNSEDAKFPLHAVDFGDVRNVNVKLECFGPFNTGDEKLASLPLALFRFTFTNKNSASADAAVAFQFDNDLLQLYPTLTGEPAQGFSRQYPIMDFFNQFRQIDLR